MSDEEKLQAANALDKAYADAAAFDAAQKPTKTVYVITWDNGGSASGSFPEEYATEEEAEATLIQENNIAEGIWDEDGFCEVISVQVLVDNEPEENEDELLRKAALSRGLP